jgi:hypothetical protein
VLRLAERSKTISMLLATRLQHNHWSDYEHTILWSTSDLFINDKDLHRWPLQYFKLNKVNIISFKQSIHMNRVNHLHILKHIQKNK